MSKKSAAVRKSTGKRKKIVKAVKDKEPAAKRRGRKPKLGSGKRFAHFTEDLQAKGYSPESAKRIAAFAGRRAYGKKKFQGLSAAGRKRHK